MKKITIETGTQTMATAGMKTDRDKNVEEQTVTDQQAAHN